MILFQHKDKKVQCFIDELRVLGVKSEGVVVRHPVLNPLFVLKYIFFKKIKIDVYVFRYVNDSNNFLLAILRYLSDIFLVLILKTFKIRIWWLCHNVDKETSSYFPKFINLRRKLIAKNAEIIFTTNKHLVDKAKSIFKEKKVDYISLGYIESGLHSMQVDDDVQHQIQDWILDKKNKGEARFIFCIGAPAKKSLHFEHINALLDELNKQTNYNWYAVVIGKKVKDNQNIFNVPTKCILSKEFIIQYSDYFYRILNDYSISYSLFEAVNYKKPIITENYGIIPKIVEEYELGVVLYNYENLKNIFEQYSINDAKFKDFELDNNWSVAAMKFKSYYDSPYNK